MTRDIQISRGISPYTGQLAKGCRQCMKGAKLVLFITGKCPKDCYYCPISEERYDQDVTFANEVEVKEIDQAIAEAQLIDATGMGITGGEPFLELERMISYIQAFKQAFGETFHIHLYTGLEPVPLEAVRQLVNAGLDELRLHRFDVGEDYIDLQKLMKGKGKLGLEIPVIPGMLKPLKELLKQFNALGIDFINLNEMEFADLNAQKLRQRGFKLDTDSIAAVQSSEDEALELLEWAAKETSLNIHYCPLALKDGTQLRNRFKRRAKNIAKPFERISQEGLLVKGVIIPKTGMSLLDVYEMLETEYEIQSAQVWINELKNRLETSTRIVRRIAKRLKAQGFDIGIVEEYPIATRFQVSYSPL
jgi:pyruvate formate-lyase activating enzyme-like uncharacterized protein